MNPCPRGYEPRDAANSINPAIVLSFGCALFAIRRGFPLTRRTAPPVMTPYLPYVLALRRRSSRIPAGRTNKVTHSRATSKAHANHSAAHSGLCSPCIAVRDQPSAHLGANVHANDALRITLASAGHLRIVKELQLVHRVGFEPTQAQGPTALQAAYLSGGGLWNSALLCCRVSRFRLNGNAMRLACTRCTSDTNSRAKRKAQKSRRLDGFPSHLHHVEHPKASNALVECFASVYPQQCYALLYRRS